MICSLPGCAGFRPTGLSYALAVAGLAGGTYQTVENFRSGQYVTAAVGAVFMAFGVASLLAGAYGQGGSGAGGGFNNNAALAIAEDVCMMSDSPKTACRCSVHPISSLLMFFLRAKAGLRSKTTGDYGHAGVATDADGFMTVKVGSSDNRGIDVAPNSNPAVGGRTWDVFRVPGTRPQAVRAFFRAYGTEGGLRQYFGNAGGNVCSSSVARSIEAGGGAFAPRAIGNLVTPNALGRFYGPPVGRVMMPVF